MKRGGRRPVIMSNRAAADLEQIAAYIAGKAPARGTAFVDRLLVRCQAIGSFPRAERARPELGGVRIVTFERYLIVYAIRATDVVIARILHGARDTGAALSEEGDA